MANRHLSRQLAMQSLYAWDFGGQTGNIKEIVKDFSNSDMITKSKENKNISFVYYYLSLMVCWLLSRYC